MKALVAMSGGVDSSVAAALMLDQGFDVIGVTLKQWEAPDGSLPTAGCCTVSDAEDARRVAATLGVPYYVLDYVDRFRESVVEPFGRAYLSGSTPNPCVECNRKVRFSALLERTTELGCDVLVTGHHARIRTDSSGHHLLRAVDGTKDQSYVLHMLGQRELDRIRLPVGEMSKDRVREIAAGLGLRTAGKPDSQDLCFVGRGDYRDFIAGRFPESSRPGAIVDVEGAVVGEHTGTAGFTIGQRRGLGISAASPRYVVAIRPDTATVVVGGADELEVREFTVRDVTFVAGDPPSDPAVEVKVRYRSQAVQANIEYGDGSWIVRLLEPQRAIAPGQAAVFYTGEEVIGGGTIATADPAVFASQSAGSVAD